MFDSDLKKSSKPILCFYIYSFLIFLYYSFSYSEIEFLKNDIIVVLALPFLFYKLIKSNFSLYEFKIVSILSVIAIISYLITGEIAFAIVISLLIGFKDVDLQTVIKLYFFVNLSSFLVIILLSIFNVISNIQIEHIRFGVVVIRNSVGFGHPNAFGLRFFSIVAAYYLAYCNQFKFKTTFILFVLNVILFIINGSRTAFLCTLVLLLFILLLHYLPTHIIKKVSKFFVYIYPLSFFTVVIIFMLYDSVFIQFVNELMMYRFSFVKLYLDKIGISLFGNNISKFNLGVTLDMGWANLFLKFGLIITSLVSYAYYMYMKRLYNRRGYLIIIILSIICLYGFSENILYSVAFNPGVLFLSDLLFDSKSCNKEGV